MVVHFICGGCDGEVEAALNAPLVAVPCPACGVKRELHPGESIVVRNLIDACVLCGCELLYTQRDFNRKLGLTIVIIGAILSIFTYGISLLVCALFDFLLYRFLPQVTVCYRCQCLYRGFAGNPKHQAYDIHTAEIFAHESPKPS